MSHDFPYCRVVQTLKHFRGELAGNTTRPSVGSPVCIDPQALYWRTSGTLSRAFLFEVLYAPIPAQRWPLYYPTCLAKIVPHPIFMIAQ